MNPILIVYGVTLAVIAAVPGFVAITRQRSGRVRTTEAETLWKVLTDHGNRVQATAERLQLEVEQRTAETAACKEELSEVRDEVRRLKAQVGQ